MMFGFQGVWQATFVMYDRETRSEWLHMTGEAFKGDLLGSRMKMFPARHVLWSEWKRDHPQTDVMTPVCPEDYFPRDDVIRGSGPVPDFVAGTLHDVSNAMNIERLVYGVEHAGHAIAYSFKALNQTDHCIVNDLLAGDPIIVGLNRKTQSPFGYRRTLNKQVLSFQSHTGDRLFESTTRSVFNEAGLCVSGTLEGQQLSPLGRSMQCEWFGWYSSRPHTKVWTPPGNDR